MQINMEQYQMTDDKKRIKEHSKDIKALLEQSYWAKERTFSTQNGEQYTTIGAFWDEMSKMYGIENLMGLGCNWTDNSIEYVMALKQGIIENANYKIDLPDEWIVVCGKTEQLSVLYEEIYKEGPLLYEIEEFDNEGNCQIKYCR